jgi:hypothetical protein
VACTGTYTQGKGRHTHNKNQRASSVRQLLPPGCDQHDMHAYHSGGTARRETLVQVEGGRGYGGRYSVECGVWVTGEAPRDCGSRWKVDGEVKVRRWRGEGTYGNLPSVLLRTITPRFTRICHTL